MLWLPALGTWASIPLRRLALGLLVLLLLALPLLLVWVARLLVLVGW